MNEKKQGMKDESLSDDCEMTEEVEDKNDMEIAEEVNWELWRKEIMENMRKEEEERKRLIAKANLLEKSWALNRECRKFLRENVNTWEETERREERKKEEMRKEQIQKANWK